MKKVLLGTTALFALAALPHAAFADDQPVKLSVSGFFQFGYGAALQEQSKPGQWAQKTLPDAMKEYGVVDLSGDTKFANGLGAGAFVELYVPSGSNVTDATTSTVSHGNVAIRQEWIHLTGDSFGEVRFGDYTDARRAKAVVAPTWSQNTLFSANSSDIAYVGNGATTNNTTEWVGNQYMTEVAYFTPVYDGFQLALTYAPDDVVGKNSGGAFGSSTSFGSYNGSGYRDVFSAAASWTGTVDGFSISAATGLTSAAAKQQASPATTQLQNAFVWNAGATVGYGPWSVGAAYEQFHNATYYGGFSGPTGATPGIIGGGATNKTDKTADIGATYTIGNLTAGAEWSRSYRKSVGVTSSYVFDTVTPGVSYIVGPGVDVDAGVAYNVGSSNGKVLGVATGHDTVLELGTEVKF